MPVGGRAGRQDGVAARGAPAVRRGDAAVSVGLSCQPVVRLPLPSQDRAVGERQRHVGGRRLRVGVAQHRSGGADVLRGRAVEGGRVGDPLAERGAPVRGHRPRIGAAMRGHDGERFLVDLERRQKGPGLRHGGGDHVAGDGAAVGVAAPLFQMPVGGRAGRQDGVAARGAPAVRRGDAAVSVGLSCQPILGLPLPGERGAVGERQRHVGRGRLRIGVARNDASCAQVLRGYADGDRRVGDPLAERGAPVRGHRPRIGAAMRGHDGERFLVDLERRQKGPGLRHGGGDHVAGDGAAVGVAAPPRKVPVGGRAGRQDRIAACRAPVDGCHAAISIGLRRQAVLGLPLPGERGAVGECQRHVGGRRLRVGVAQHRSGGANVLRGRADGDRRIRNPLAEGTAPVRSHRSRINSPTIRNHRESD